MASEAPLSQRPLHVDAGHVVLVLALPRALAARLAALAEIEGDEPSEIAADAIADHLAEREAQLLRDRLIAAAGGAA